MAALVLVLAAMASAGFGATVLRGYSPLDEPASGSQRFGVAAGEPGASPDPSASATPSVSPSVTAAPSSTAPAPSPTRSRSRVEVLEDEVLVLVNRERSRASCPAVHRDDRLHSAARGHSVDMAEHNTMSHTGSDGSSPWQRAERAGYDDAIGENVAYGYRTPAAVMDGWMGSSGHRANILNCAARALGVGLAYSRSGTPYWTQLFGRT